MNKRLEMKEELLQALCNSLHGITTDTSANRLIQNIFKCLKDHLNAEQSIVALKNQKTDYIEIVHSKDVFQNSCKNFHRSVGNNLFGRIFYSEPIIFVTKSSPKEDYQEILVEKDFELAVVVRLGYDGRAVGFLATYFSKPINIDCHIKNFFLAVGGAISIILEREEYIRIFSELRRFDPKTGLLCTSYFIHKLEEEVNKANKFNWPLALILLDLDNYKQICNIHGISRADEVIVGVAEELKKCLRGIDVVGIAGTDDFMVYMPNTTISQAEEVMKHFRNNLSSKHFTDRNIVTSCSIGITQLKQGETLDELLWRAQSALFAARKKGYGMIVTVF